MRYTHYIVLLGGIVRANGVRPASFTAQPASFVIVFALSVSRRTRMRELPQGAYKNERSSQLSPQYGRLRLMRRDNRYCDSGRVQKTDSDIGNLPAPAKSNEGLPKIVSLFAGAGGLDLGFKAVGFKIPFAVDAAEAAVKTHKRNFPRTRSIADDLTKLKPSGVLKHVQAVISPGERIAVIGGPPCQGFSRANTGSKTDDPRNRLPSLYLKIVRKLQRFYIVDFIVFENVLGIRDKKHAKTFASLIRGIKKLGFDVTQEELCAVDFGVPQNRRRIVLFGLRKGQGYSKVHPRRRRGVATVREAIGKLPDPVFFRPKLKPDEFGTHPNHWTMQPKSPRFSKPLEETGDGRSFSHRVEESKRCQHLCNSFQLFLKNIVAGLFLGGSSPLFRQNRGSAKNISFVRFV